MSNIICERLQKLKIQLQAEANITQDAITRVMNSTMEAYATIIDNATIEEIQTLNSIKHDISNILHNVIHIKDTLRTIGQPAMSERYFNFNGGNPVEVDKEHFIGLPFDEETTDRT